MSARDRKMPPLTVVAELASPPVITGPILLDGVLVGGIGAMLGMHAPGGLKEPDEVYGKSLPLARIRDRDRWWYAASQATPIGPESRFHVHRRPPIELAILWTLDRSMTDGTGPDKALRTVHYRRPAMTRLRWTCVGDPKRIAELLAHVPAVGRLTTQGHGWVRHWTIEHGGPPLNDYHHDVRLRHIPTSALDSHPDVEGVTIRMVPIHPPYHRRRKGVHCYQVVR